MPSAYTRKKNAQEKRLNAKFRRLVLERDNYRCVLTGTPEDKENGITLEVHHVLGRVGCLKFWDPDGAITLCWSKHQKLHHGTDQERAEIQQEIESYYGPEKWEELILLKNQLFFEKDEFTEEHLNELAEECGITW